MPHDTPLISTVVAGLVLAFILGAVANRLRLPPLVGYLIAGVMVGPHTPGFVADMELATELSELGVILLMFGVGLHFSLKDLLSVRALAVPGAMVQIGGATLLGLGLALLMGWSVGGGLIFGLALSVASTVVLLKALQDRHMIESEKGKIAVGWLIVEDMAMILALVLIPTLAAFSGTAAVVPHDPFVQLVERFTGQLGIFGVVGITVVKIAAFIGFMLVVGQRVIPFALHYTAHTGSRELFRLAVLAIALGVAAGSAYLFGVSLALGAFFAGMILSESELSHRAAQESLPLRDAFSVLFFVAVGMLFDPAILIEDPLPVIATVLIIVVGKSVFAYLIVVAFRHPVGTALTISASLAQIGEFSFILASLGVGLGLLPEEGRDLILAGAIISIMLNPLLFIAVDWLRPRLEARYGGIGPAAETRQRTEPGLDMPAAPASVVETQEDEEEAGEVRSLRTGHTVLIGYGQVGSVIAETLLATRRSLVVVEDAETRVNAARAAGIEVITGNAAAGRVLDLANVQEAATVVVAIPNAFESGQTVEQARRLNPTALIIARAHSDEEVAHLEGLGANVVVLGEREIGLGMADLITRDSQAMAEVVASDAVAAALGPLAAATARGEVEPDILADAIVAAPIAHADSGPAEPPSRVSSLGEEPERKAPPLQEVLPPGSGEPVAEPGTIEVEAMTPDERLGPLVQRPARPASSPGTLFNPEVAPEPPRKDES